MLLEFDGALPPGLTAKDMILGAIGRIGVDGGVGYVVEYAGEAIAALSMEGGMTICNMSIEGGARAGMIAPDETTFAYLEGRPAAPHGRGLGARARRLAVAASDPDAEFDTSVTSSTSPSSRRRSPGARTRAWSRRSTAPSPTPPRSTTRATATRPSARSSTWASSRASAIEEIAIDRVFIGSCTNARIEDLRAAAAIVRRPHGSTRA